MSAWRVCDELLPDPLRHPADPADERTLDLYSRLLSERIIYLGTEIDDRVANAVIAQLLHLASENSDLPIGLYINSPGGSITSMLAVYDAMQFVKPRVETVCVGQAAWTAERYCIDTPARSATSTRRSERRVRPRCSSWPTSSRHRGSGATGARGWSRSGNRRMSPMERRQRARGVESQGFCSQQRRADTGPT